MCTTPMTLRSRGTAKESSSAPTTSSSAATDKTQLITGMGVMPNFDHNDKSTRQGQDNPFMIGDLLVFCLVVVPVQIHSGLRLWNSSLGPLDLAVAALISYMMVEPASGVLHVVLDNAKFNEWPLLGEVAISFQKHHNMPIEISWRPTQNFFLEAMVPYAIIGSQALFITNEFVVAVCFMLFFSTELMMFSHRWSHMANSRKPFIAKALQKSGIIMSDAHHHDHHRTYDNNFAICAGWSNPLMNYLVKNHWDEDDMRWLGVFAGFYFLPIALSSFNGEVQWPVSPV